MYLVIQEQKIIMATMSFVDILKLINGKSSIMDLEVIEISNFNNITNDLSDYYDEDCGCYITDK